MNEDLETELAQRIFLSILFYYTIEDVFDS